MTGPGDETAAERARLEEIAYGPASTPAEAARARIALADLSAGRRPRTATSSPEVRATTSDTGAADRPDGAGPGVTADPGGVTGAGTGAGSDDRVATRGMTGPDTAAATPPRTASDGGAGTAAPTEAVVRTAEVPSDGGTDPGLQADTPGERPRFRWPARRAWLVAGAAAAVGVAFASGIAVGAVRPDGQQAAAPSPTNGAITLTQLLDAPQSFADRLPGPLEVPVVLRSTRLVFTNRSLAGDDAGTPWNVWAGVGKDDSEICLVASADRIQATAGCYPKEAVLAGQVSLIAQSSSGVLQVRVVGGVVRGTVSDGLGG